jgi:hypothetical protein
LRIHSRPAARINRLARSIRRAPVLPLTRAFFEPAPFCCIPSGINHNQKGEHHMKTKPINEIRFGNFKAAIWQNETEHGTRHNVTFSRSFKDGEQWRSSDSFGRDDLPKLILAAQKAYEGLFQTTREEPSDPEEV